MNIGKIKTAIVFLGIAIAIELIVLGAVSGEAQQMLAKAVKICMECIGIG